MRVIIVKTQRILWSRAFTHIQKCTSEVEIDTDLFATTKKNRRSIIWSFGQPILRKINRTNSNWNVRQENAATKSTTNINYTYCRPITHHLTSLSCISRRITHQIETLQIQSMLLTDAIANLQHNLIVFFLSLVDSVIWPNKNNRTISSDQWPECMC